MKFYENPTTLIAEQDQFELDIKAFASGKINPVKFKALRVAHGVYEQRQEHTYMIRIRCAAGGITPAQLKKVAELGKLYGSGEVHFTTRQEVQVHDVLLQNVIKVIRGLNEVDLSSRGGGGNTIRNILTSPLSGIEPGETFDVDPYAIALTTRMISEPDSWNLPRKFKMAFSNSEADTAFTQTTCLGFIASIQDGQKGFRIFCAGGMGAKPMVGHELVDFIPEEKVYHVTKAIKIMFDKHGNRRSKYSSRIKFLWKKLDEEQFKALFYEEYNKLKDDSSLTLDINPIENAGNDPEIPVESVDSAEYELWKTRYVSQQKQAGLITIKMPLILGDLMTEDAYKLCDFLAQFGPNTIRCDRAQNMRLRNIPQQYVGNVYNIVKTLSHTLVEHAPFIANMINCTGAQTCKLGICLPRGLSTALRERLMTADLNLDAIPQFQLNMSGCPNTCGMHHIADLGFFGKIGRKDGNIYPAYNILVGAKVGAGKTEYAKKVSDLPAHSVPEFVERFLKLYIEEKDEYPDYQTFLTEEGIPFIEEITPKLKEVPALDEDNSVYIDFGAKRPLRLDDMGTAECSAGMFDMINVDRRHIEGFLKDFKQTAPTTDSLSTMLFHTSRMLLVTRGLDAASESQALSLFAKHFVQTELVSLHHLDLLEEAKKGNKGYLTDNKQRVIALSEEVLALYKSMDDSLRFKAPETKEKSKSAANTDVAEKKPEINKDFRGVACPMNFVKTKLVLETLNTGDILTILLDDGEPIQNVPNSVKLEGHQVLGQEKESDGSWKVIIKKA